MEGLKYCRHGVLQIKSDKTVMVNPETSVHRVSCFVRCWNWIVTFHLSLNLLDAVKHLKSVRLRISKSSKTGRRVLIFTKQNEQHFKKKPKYIFYIQVQGPKIVLVLRTIFPTKDRVWLISCPFVCFSLNSQFLRFIS